MTEETTFQLNGRQVTVVGDPGRSLVETLREDLEATSVRVSCGIGLCGTCTVLVDGQAVSGCLLLTGMVAGRRVETVEGQPGSAAADAFVECSAFQCSFCIPAMVLTAQAAVDRGVRDEHALLEELAGNLCRCGSYPQIRQAIARLASPEEQRS